MRVRYKKTIFLSLLVAQGNFNPLMSVSMKMSNDKGTSMEHVEVDLRILCT